MREIFFCVFTVLLSTISLFASDIVLSKKEVSQGGFFTVTIARAPTWHGYRVKFLGRTYETVPLNSRAQFAIVPVDITDPIGAVSMTIESDFEVAIPQMITISESVFGKSSESTTQNSFSKKERARYGDETKLLSMVYAKNTRYVFFNPKELVFGASPLEFEAKIAFSFGAAHRGIDYEAGVRTPVAAVLDGIVRVARDLLLSGKTVVIDHGAGFMTTFFHLSEIAVREGDFVHAGERFAASGKSGKTHGTSGSAHLHFGVIAHGTWIDPQEFFVGGAK